VKSLDILAFGEPLMEFAEVERGGERLYLPGFGGDVSNAAIAAARQGARCPAGRQASISSATVRRAMSFPMHGPDLRRAS
jgi:hypothetical protein